MHAKSALPEWLYSCVHSSIFDAGERVSAGSMLSYQFVLTIHLSLPQWVSIPFLSYVLLHLLMFNLTSLRLSHWTISWTSTCCQVAAAFTWSDLRHWLLQFNPKPHSLPKSSLLNTVLLVAVSLGVTSSLTDLCLLLCASQVRQVQALQKTSHPSFSPPFRNSCLGWGQQGFPGVLPRPKTLGGSKRSYAGPPGVES